jgi:transglutaminase-like putative cysteine protease
MIDTRSLSIKDVAYMLKRDTEWLTARAVERWVREHIRWDFHYYAMGLEACWKERAGDCTDMAMLMQELLKLNSIHSHIVHGYGTWNIPGKDPERVKHDWLLATIHDITGAGREIQYDGVAECQKYELVGDGYW